MSVSCAHQISRSLLKTILYVPWLSFNFPVSLPYQLFPYESFTLRYDLSVYPFSKNLHFFAAGTSKMSTFRQSVLAMQCHQVAQLDLNKDPTRLAISFPSSCSVFQKGLKCFSDPAIYQIYTLLEKTIFVTKLMYFSILTLRVNSGLMYLVLHKYK